MQFNVSKLIYRLTAPGFLFLAATSLGLSIANASEVRKVFDGTAAYCPPTEDYKPVVPETALRAVVDGSELAITLNVCENGQWKLDPALPVHRYTAPSGETVELRYDNFRLVVQTLDWSKTKFIPLTNFSVRPSARISISDIEFINAQALDISLTAVRTTKTSNGHVFVEDVHWGALRLLK